MADMNELLEEAAGRCSALSDELDDTVNGIKQLVERANDVWEAVSKGGEEVHGQLRDLAGKLDAAEEAVEGAAGQAGSDLDSVGSKAAEVRANVGELLQKVQGDLTELETLKNELQQTLASDGQGVATDVSDLTSKVQTVQQGIAKQLQEAGQKIEAFRASLESARTELVEKQTTWTEAVDRLEEAARQQTQEWVTGLQTLLAGQSHAMLNLANRMITNHNQTMEKLKTKFATEVAQEIAAAITPLRDSLERLGSLAAARSGDVSTRSDEVLQRVRAALPVLEELKTVFETSSRLE